MKKKNKPKQKKTYAHKYIQLLRQKKLPLHSSLILWESKILLQTKTCPSSLKSLMDFLFNFQKKSFSYLISLKKKQNWQSTTDKAQCLACSFHSLLLASCPWGPSENRTVAGRWQRGEGHRDSSPLSPISKDNSASDSHRPLQAEVPQRGVAGNDLLLAERVTAQLKSTSSQNSPNQIKLIFSNTYKPSSCSSFLFYPFFYLSSPNLAVETLTQKELISGYQGKKKKPDKQDVKYW